MAHDGVGDAGPDVGAQPLGVVEVAEGAPARARQRLEVKADRRDDQGAGQAPAPGLVGAGDPARAERPVVGEQPRRGAVGSRSPFDRPRAPSTRRG